MTTTMKPSGGGTWCSKEIFMKNLNFEISENPFITYNIHCTVSALHIATSAEIS